MSQRTTQTATEPVIELSYLNDDGLTSNSPAPSDANTNVGNPDESNVPVAEDESQYPTGRKRAVMLAA
jgi:hypothetical protein